MAAAVPAVGWCRVFSTDPPLSVVARLSEDRPNVDQGYGGWNEVARPRRSPLTTFTGSPGLHLTLPLLLDKFTTGASVEVDIARLQKMGQPTAADGEPPRVRVVARGGAIPYQGRRWVINDLQMGDAEMNAAGDRTRQHVTLSLIEYVEDVHLAQRSAANRRRAKAAAVKQKRGAAQKRVNAKRSSKAVKKKTRAVTRAGRAVVSSSDDFGQGEDLLTIAARELGDADRWIEIAELNGLRDPRAIAPNQVLRLP